MKVSQPSKIRCLKQADALENTELRLEPATSFCRIKGSEKALLGEELPSWFCHLENKPSLTQQLASGHDHPGVTTVLHPQEKVLSLTLKQAAQRNYLQGNTGVWRLAGRRCGCPCALTGQVGEDPRAVLTSSTTAIHEGTRLTHLLCGGNRGHIDTWEKNSCRREKKWLLGVREGWPGCLEHPAGIATTWI